MSTNFPLSAAREFIQKNRARLLENWFHLIRQPSISLTGEGIPECCDLIINKMKELGIETVKHEVNPYPVIEGRYGRDPHKKTILIYAHYDVKPAEPLEQWRTPPFEPTVVDSVVYGRGSADNKSPLMAHLEAVDFYLKEMGDIPVNLIFLFEGCEEEGSRGLLEFVQSHRDELVADLVFFSDGPKDPGGLPIIALGAKGILNITLKVRTMAKNVHSRYAAVLPSAAWRLVELLGCLKTGDTVHIPGFYDGISLPGEKEMAILEGLPSTDKQLEELCGGKIVRSGRNFYDQLNNTPTFNISCIESGAAGVVPATATAQIDIRLVAGQNPDDMFAKLVRYIRQLGYDDVEIIRTGSVLPSKTDVNTPFLPIVEKAVKAIYGEYVIYPCRPSTAPDYLWTNILQLPAIQVRWSDPDSDNHAPNEHLTISEYLNGIALTIQVIHEIANI